MSSVSSIKPTDTASYGNYRSTVAKDFLAKSAADTKSATDTKPAEDTAAVKAADQEVAAVYEKSEEGVASAKKTYTPNTALVNQLKADAEARTEQLRSIVQQMISGQGQAYGTAMGDDSIWKMFADGKFSNVSEAAIAQAKEDIAEGGYYSVDETANRIVDFAKALTGGDPDQIDKMMDAFKKGFDQATKAWGKELPEISSKTYDAVLQGFEDWRNEDAAAKGVSSLE